MKQTFRFFLIFSLIVTLGLGCQNKTTSQDDSGDIEVFPRMDLEAPSNIKSTFLNAKALGDTHTETYQEEAWQTKASVNIPASWTGKGSVWRPDESSMSYIRVKYVLDLGPATEWQNQQQLDTHEVLYTHEEANYYELLVSNEALKASMYKRFIKVPESDQNFYLLECRIGFEEDQNQAWGACRAAIDSFAFETNS